MRLVKKFLQLFELPPDYTIILHRRTCRTPAQAPPENRDKWEAEARYILAKQGLINPDTVKYMGDEMLIHIIRNYLDI